MLDEALRLAGDYGWSLLPLLPRAKRPLITKWPDLATPDPATLREWWQMWPNANIGVATGPKSGIFVLDVDGPEGQASLEQLKSETDWPNTLAALTGSGGFHFYFRWDDEHPLRNSAKRLAAGLDIRGEGGYVAAPPSIHPNGRRYEWISV